MEDYRVVNLRNWDERAPAHAKSPGYALQRFREDPDYLSHVVRFDVPRLGDLTGLRGVHLQCHIGTDTVSLARLGATMTGLDFSPAALVEARALSDETGAGVRFVESELYGALAALGEDRFDFVFTGIGALCWLPDITGWAQIVAALLVPGGRLLMREGHPMLWGLDDERADELVVTFPYFARPEPIVWNSDSSYVPTDAPFTATETHDFSHGLGEIVTAVLAAGLELTLLEEHDSVPWEALPGQMTLDERGEWQLTDRPWRLAHSYTLHARKPERS